MKHATTRVHCSPASHQRSWQTRAAWAVVGLEYALCGHIALAQEKSASKDSLLPSRSAAPVPAQGLASLYPGDEGIERDPRVLFVEDFETGNLQEIESRWGNRRVAAARMELVPDRHAASPGERSLFIGIGGPDALQPGCCGGHLYTHTRAVDQIHVRFYNVDKGTDQHNNDPDPQSRRYEAWFDDVVMPRSTSVPCKAGRRAARRLPSPGKVRS